MRPPYLSVSSVQLFNRCPAAYKRRYIDRVYDPPSPAMAFGSIFANALEALHRGYDAEMELVKIHAATVKAGQPVRPGADYGLRLLALYREHGVYAGEPERRFRVYLPDRMLVPVPIVGYMDLERHDEAGKPIGVCEFKTSGMTWTDVRVHGEMQGHVYGFAFHQAYGHWPEVEYLVFGTRTPTLSTFMTRPTGEDIRAFEEAAGAMLAGVARGDFEPCGACYVCKPPSSATTDGPVLEFGFGS